MGAWDMEGIEMRISLLSITLLLAVAAPECAQTASPLMTTDGKKDTKVVIAEQSVTSIKFQILPEAKAVRFALMVRTKGKDSKFIEEPVRITVESEGTRPETCGCLSQR
jgi:hypothetical protein